MKKRKRRDESAGDATFSDLYVPWGKPLPRCSVCFAETLTEVIDVSTFDQRIQMEIPTRRCPNGPHEVHRG